MNATPDLALVVPNDERHIRDSVLQELTVSAFELFDPRTPMDAFMDSVAMRLGCAAVFALNFRGDHLELLSAAGLSTNSRKLPLPTCAEFRDGVYPWPEVRRDDLDVWDFDLSDRAMIQSGDEVHLVLFIPRDANISPLYRGLLERLCRIICSALHHRRLFATVLKNEEELFATKSLYLCIANGSSDGMIFQPIDGPPLCNRRFLDIAGMSAQPQNADQLSSHLVSLIEAPRDLLARMARQTFLATARAHLSEKSEPPRDHQGIELLFHDGREFLFFCLPVTSPEGVRFGHCWYLREVTAQNRARRERLSLLTQEREARAISEKARLRLSFLTDAGQILLSSLDLEQLLQNIVRHCLPTLADVCAIDLFDQGEDRHVVAAVAGDPPSWVDLNGFTLSLDAEAGPGHVMATGTTELWPRLNASDLERFTKDDNVRQLLASLGLTSAIYVPLLARGRCIGVMTLGATTSGRVYGEDDRLLAEDLGMRVAMAVDNARLFRRSEKAIELRDNFLSSASHELRTPITAFRLATLGLCRLVESGRLTRADMPMLRDALDTARRQSARLERLVHRLLDTSRLDTHRVPPQPEPLDLAYVMEEVLHDFREEIRAAGAEIVLDLKPTPGRWDRSFIEQIFTNLLTNALKFAGTRPIEISVAPDGDWARLIVRDHGIGIPKGDQERIFERFERAVSPKDYSGFGIGLTIVRDLLQAMGGRVHVDSDSGQGATFTVELPREC